MTSREGAVLILCNTAGEIALQLRDDIPDTWGLFGGWLEPDESPDAAAQRELAEELAVHLALERLQLLGTHEELEHFLAYVYHIALTNELDDAVLQEGLAWGFFSPETAASMKLIPHQRDMLRRFGYL